MNIKKTLLVTGTVATLGVSAASFGIANAASGDSGVSSLATKIAQKFNLQASDVQTVIDEEHESHKADMQKRMEERLNTAVDEGKLTAGQKDKILAKLEELRTHMQTSRDDLENMTQEQRREARRQLHDDLTQWAEDNNIPLEYLQFRMHFGGPGFMKPTP